jgi:hypothetical protein
MMHSRFNGTKKPTLFERRETRDSGQWKGFIHKDNFSGSEKHPDLRHLFVELSIKEVNKQGL